jgi:hypothetical protein
MIFFGLFAQCLMLSPDSFYDHQILRTFFFLSASVPGQQAYHVAFILPDPGVGPIRSGDWGQSLQ